MAIVRFFAAARDATGTARDTIDGRCVDDVVSEATRRYGERFAEVVPTCKIWLNGEPATGGEAVSDDDEVAVLPPVSGG